MNSAAVGHRLATSAAPGLSNKVNELPVADIGHLSWISPVKYALTQRGLDGLTR